MFETLLHLGMVATAFMFIPGGDLREIKMIAALIFAMSLISVEFYTRGISKFNNKWFLILLAYIPVSVMLAPNPAITLIGIDVSHFWCWEPMLYILIFSLMIMSIASHEFKREDVYRLLRTMVYCGAFTATYMVLQFFMIDQWFEPISSFINGRGHVAGFIGNPTLTSPFVAMIIPIALYLKRHILALIMIISVFLTDSQMGYGAMIVSLIFYFSMFGAKRFVLCGLTMVVLSASLILVWNNQATKNFINPNERFFHWKQIAIDIKSPLSEEIKTSYPITGRGLGSFKYVYHVEHPGGETTPNRFQQAHNDYLEFAYSCGLAGLALLLAAIFTMFKNNFSVYEIFKGNFDRRTAALLASFSCIAMCAFGTFAWQIGTTIFYSALLVGLLHNETLGD